MQIQHEEVIFSAVKNRTPLEIMQLLCDEELVIHFRCIISLLTLLKSYNWIVGTAFKHQFTLKMALLSNKSGIFKLNCRNCEHRVECEVYGLWRPQGC